MIGELKIVALRDRARAMLGEKMRGRERESESAAGEDAESGADGGDARAGVLQAARCFA